MDVAHAAVAPKDSRNPTPRSRGQIIHPNLSGLRRELEVYLAYYNHDRVHHGRLTRGQIPADIIYGARKMEAR